MIYLEVNDSNGVREICRANGLRHSLRSPGRLLIELEYVEGKGYFVPPALANLKASRKVDLSRVPIKGSTSELVCLDVEKKKVANGISTVWDGADKTLVLVKCGLVVACTGEGYHVVYVDQPKPNNRNHLSVWESRNTYVDFTQLEPWIWALVRPVFARAISVTARPASTKPKRTEEEKKRRREKQERLDNLGKASKGRGAAAGQKVKQYKKGQWK